MQQLGLLCFNINVYDFSDQLKSATLNGYKQNLNIPEKKTKWRCRGSQNRMDYNKFYSF